MKAMRLTALGRMEMSDVPDPVLRDPGEVLIRLGAVGVCGSDVHYYETGRIGSQVVRYPFTVGHEAAGLVEEVGPGVTRVKPGDPIAIEPAVSCGGCDQCRAGRVNTCRALKFLGCPGQLEGCLCERIVMPEACCLPLPEGLTLEHGALSEPLSIGVYAVRKSVPMDGAAIGILGSGPIGLSVLLAARDAGAGRVYVTDKIESRLQAASSAGAAWIGNPHASDIVAEIAAREPRGLDVVFECCGQPDAVDQGLRLLKPGGMLSIIGIPREERLAFEVDLMRRREVTIYNVRRQAHCVQPALEGLASGALKADFMVTHRFAFEDTPAAFDLVARRDDGVIKAMIRW